MRGSGVSMRPIAELRQRIALRISAIDHLIGECEEGHPLLLELLARRSEVFNLLHEIHTIETQQRLEKRK